MTMSIFCTVSSTAIPELVGVEAIMGFHLSSENSVWAQHYWTWSNDSTRVSREELSTWLHRLYVQIVLPAERESMNMVREECPNTIATFVSVCDFLIRVRHFPARWIVLAIEALLQGNGQKFLSLARPPSKLPNRYEPLETAEMINLSFFRSNEKCRWHFGCRNIAQGHSALSSSRHVMGTCVGMN